MPLSILGIVVRRGHLGCPVRGAAPPLEPRRTLARHLPGWVRCGPGWGLTLSLQVQRRGQAPPGHGAEACARACRCGHRPAEQTSWESQTTVSASPTHAPLTAPLLPRTLPHLCLSEDSGTPPPSLLRASALFHTRYTQLPGAPVLFDQSTNGSTRVGTGAID